jgi:hypothetical protein
MEENKIIQWPKESMEQYLILALRLKLIKVLYDISLILCLIFYVPILATKLYNY